MDRFLICENPIKGEGDTPLYILHTISPEMVIEIHHEAIAVGDGKLFLTGNYQNSDGEIETITLVIAKVFSDEELAEDFKEKLNKTLSRAWHWYIAYLKWEDGNIDTNTFSKNN